MNFNFSPIWERYSGKRARTISASCAENPVNQNRRAEAKFASGLPVKSLNRASARRRVSSRDTEATMVQLFDKVGKDTGPGKVVSELSGFGGLVCTDILFF